jgi:hypothetical protein
MSENNSNFTFLLGGKVPEDPNLEKIHNEKEIKRQEESGNVDFSKWNSCKWKSEIEQTYIKSCCGRSETVFCINCKKLGIQQIHPLICSRCNHFEQKENI